MSNIAVVIGEDHYNTLGLVRSLGEVDIPVYLFVKTGKSKAFVSKSKYVKEFWLRETIDEIVDEICKIQNLHIVVYCSSDVIISNVERLKDKFPSNVILPQASEELGGIAQLTNKGVVTNIVKYLGLQVPKSWTVDKASVASFTREILPSIDFKCIIKPSKSEYGIKDDIKICNTKEEIIVELSNLLKKIESLEVQEFIDKDVEINLLGSSLLDGNVIVPGIMYKLKHNRNHYEFYSEIRVHNEKMNNIVEKVKEFINYIGYRGLFGVEMIVSGDNVYFLEVNLRNDANSYSITNGGVNLPQIYFNSACNIDNLSVKTFLSKKCNYVNEIAYFKYLFETKFEILEFFKVMFTADCYMYFNRKDIKPFVYKWLY